MGEKVFVYDRVGGIGKAAIYVEPDTGPKDAPFTDPMDHLEAIEFDTEVFDYLEVAFRQQVTKSHAAVAAQSPPPGTNYEPDVVVRGAYTLTQDLVTHNLGYVPFCIVVIAGVIAPPGIPIQTNGNSRRYLQAIVTDTKVQVKETADVGASPLSSGSATYDVIVFRQPFSGALQDLDLSVSPGAAYLKAGRFDSTKRYLRVAASEDSQFFIGKGKTADASNAVCLVIAPDGTGFYDVVYTGSPALNYNGTFSAVDIVSYEVSVADDDEEDGETSVDIGANGLKIVDDGHVVFDTSRRLAGVFQTVDLTNKAFTSPAPAGDYYYLTTALDVGAGYILWECRTYYTLKPQEWTQTIELATLDSDKGDFLLALVKGSRTKNPAQWTMDGATFFDVAKRMPENVVMPVAGTIILESEFFFRRTITFDIQGNKLVAILQQSVRGIDTQAIRPNDFQGGKYTDLSSTSIEVPIRHVDVRSGGIPVSDYHSTYKEGMSGCCTIPASNAYDYGSIWTFSELHFAVGRITPGTASA